MNLPFALNKGMCMNILFNFFMITPSRFKCVTLAIMHRFMFTLKGQNKHVFEYIYRS